MAEVITLVLKSGDGYVVLEGQGVGECTLCSQPRVGQEAEVAGAEASLPREKVIVGTGEPCSGQLIDEQGAVQVQMPDIVGAYIKEHLRVAVVDAGVDGMVNRLVEEDRHKVVRGDAGIGPYDTVAGGYVQPLNRGECEDVCGDVLAAVVLAVCGAVCITDPV